VKLSWIVAMDITQLFKACVKSARLQNKSIPALDKNRILKKSPKDEFGQRTRDIKNQISQLRNFLIENRAAYMQFACHLKRSAQVRNELDTVKKIYEFYGF
jgi:syntaxin 18